MKSAIILTGGLLSADLVGRIIEEQPDADLIGIDGGCAIADQLGLKLDLMIGDFDSLDETIFRRMQKNTQKCVRLNPIKDQTDTHAAYDYLIQEKYECVYVLGSTGSRFDHTLANVYVAMKYAKDMVITCIDEHNKFVFANGACVIYANHFNDTTMCNEGRRLNLEDISDFKYVSIVPMDTTYILKTEGLKYPLNKYELDPYDSFSISNEATGPVTIFMEYGKAIIIASKD